MALLFALLLPYQAMYGQAKGATVRVVTGTVTDATTDEALVGVNIVVVGSTGVGTVTDLDGKYLINVPSSGSALQFTYVGYSRQVIDLGTSNTIDVQMNEDRTLMGEVVVTALGISRDSKTLGYSTAKVDGDAINATKNNSALDALNAKVPGLVVSTASGAPGASTVLNIRGFNSVTGNNQPLFIVDGVPLNNRGNGGSTSALNSSDDFNRSTDFGNQMNDINPADIESIDVLKGSAASALYGSRAANGVVLITTKKGNANRIKVDFNTSYTQSEVLRVPFLQNTYGQGWSGLSAYEENGSWGPKADGKVRLWGNVVNNSQQLKPFVIQEDNLREFFEIGRGFNTGLSLGSGNENSNYRFSYSFANADGVVPSDGDTYKRHTFGFNGGTRYNKLSIGSSINYVNKNQSAVATGQGDDSGAGNVVWQEIIQMPRDHSIVDYEKYNDPTDPARDFYNLDNFFTPYAQNPYWTLYNQGNQYDEDRVYGNIELGYDILTDLKLMWRGGADVSNAFQKDWGNLGIINDGTPNSSANDVVGAVAEISRKNQQFNSDLFLTWKRQLSDKLDLSATVGHNINARNANLFVSQVTNLVIPDYFSLSNTTVTPVTRRVISQRRLVGVYGSVSLGFDRWLYLSLGGRNDRSSTLPIENNSYFYPSASVSAVLSDAFTMPSKINYLKLRAGYARTGNDADPYQVLPVFIAGQSRAGGFGSVLFPFGGVNAYELSNNAGNKNLRPELTSEVEFGVETKLFMNRLGLDLTYFNRNTSDQIINLLVEAASGYTNQTTNLGKVQNKGWEIALSGTPVRTRNFTWDLNWNYTKIDNEVLELGHSDKTSILLNSSYDIDLRAEVGKPLGAIYAPQEATDPNGNVIVNPVTGLPQLADDKEYMGSINPDFTMGFGTALSAFGLTLGADGDYRQGGVFYSYTARLNYFVGNAWETQYNDREPWIIPNSVVDAGDGTFVENTTPVSRADVFTYYGATDSWQNKHVLPKTFFKLRNLYLNYQLPTAFVRKANIEKATIGVFGRNLILWTPSGNHFVDPESNTFGTDLSSMYGEFSTGPSSYTYGIQLNVTF